MQFETSAHQACVCPIVQHAAAGQGGAADDHAPLLPLVGPKAGHGYTNSAPWRPGTVTEWLCGRDPGRRWGLRQAGDKGQGVRRWDGPMRLCSTWLRAVHAADAGRCQPTQAAAPPTPASVQRRTLPSPHPPTEEGEEHSVGDHTLAVVAAPERNLNHRVGGVHLRVQVAGQAAAGQRHPAVAGVDADACASAGARCGVVIGATCNG